VTREALVVLDERMAASDLATLAASVPALNDAVRASLKGFSKWLAAAPVTVPAVQEALEDLRVAHVKARLLGGKAGGAVTTVPAFDLDLEHAAVAAVAL